MTELQMFYVWAFCDATDINTIIQFVPDTPEHVLVNTRNSCHDAFCFRSLTVAGEGARGSIDGWGGMVQAGRSRVQSPMRQLNFLNLPNTSSRTVAPRFTQPLTEMSIRSRKIMFLESRAPPVRRGDNLAAICEPIVWTIWDSQHLTTL
jgi:hypothetical protein